MKRFDPFYLIMICMIIITLFCFGYVTGHRIGSYMGADLWKYVKFH